MMNAQPRSGAGATTEYKSQWDFYSDLLFLIDHIEPKKPYSNMSSSKSCMQSLIQAECDEKNKNKIYITPELSTTVKNDHIPIQHSFQIKYQASKSKHQSYPTENTKKE